MKGLFAVRLHHLFIVFTLIILLGLTNLAFLTSGQVTTSFDLVLLKSNVPLLPPAIPLESTIVKTIPQNWQCGSTNMQLTAAYHWANLISSDVVEDLNQCCISHDLGYDECADRESVDLVFAECLVNACSQSTAWSFSKHGCTNLVANVFSHLVQAYGETAHKRACEAGKNEDGTVRFFL